MGKKGHIALCVFLLMKNLSKLPSADCPWIPWAVTSLQGRTGDYLIILVSKVGDGLCLNGKRVAGGR